MKNISGEILRVIFNHLEYPPDRTQTLLACALVCKLWAQWAQRQLFTKPIFNQVVPHRSTSGLSRVERFLYAIDQPTDHSKSLAHNVIRLSIVQRVNPAEPFYTLDLVEARLVARVVFCCPNLQSLTWVTEGSKGIAEISVEEKMWLQKAEKVNSLNLKGCTLADVMVFLKYWPSLTTLELENIRQTRPPPGGKARPSPTGTSQHQRQTLPSATCALRELHAPLWVVHQLDTRLHPLVDLRMLTTFSAPADCLGQVLSPLKSTLKVLKIRHDCETNQDFSPLASMIALTELYVGAVAYAGPKNLFTSFPPSLVSLQLEGLKYPETFGHHLDELASGILELNELRRLAVGWKKSVDEYNFDKLVEVCREKRVMLWSGNLPKKFLVDVT